MCKQTGTKGDTICDIELGNNPLVSNKHKDMGHANFDNPDYHTAHTLALLLHSEEFQASLVYQL